MSHQEQQSYLICIMGKSGSGKDTLVNDLCRTPVYFPHKPPRYLKQIISYTTRPRRKGEGPTHHFSQTPPAHKDSLLAHTVYQGNEYWTTFDQLKDSDLYIIDPAGLKYLVNQVRNSDKIIKSVYIKVHWWKRLWRISHRNSLFYAIRRVIHDHKIFKHAEEQADYVLYNNSYSQFIVCWQTILNLFHATT